MKSTCRPIIAAIVTVFIAAGGLIAGPFDDLLRRVPNTANAVLFANIRALYNSPLGKKQNWELSLQRNFQGGLIGLPPVAERVVIAQHIDPGTLKYNYRLELVQMGVDVKPEQVVRREAGALDQIDNVPIMLDPRGSYYVFFTPRVVGEGSPADRQKLSKWIYFSKANKTPVVSRYLRDAAEDAAVGAQIVFAVDLKDLFDQSGLARGLKVANSLKGKKMDVNAMAKTLATVLGFRITVKVDSEIKGEVRLDFAGAPDVLAPVAKELILEAMASIGAAVDDLDSWQSRIIGDSVVLRGKLTVSGARLLLSPAANRMNSPAYAELSQSQNQPPPDPKATASLRYFRTLNSMITELNGAKDAKKLSSRSYIYQQYATKIDSMPLLNVDQELLQLGAGVSSALRAMANLSQATKRNANQITANAVDVAVPVGGYSGYGYGGYGYGGYGWNYRVPDVANVNNYSQVYNMVAQTARTEQALRQQTWKNINDSMFAMRKKMVDKYMIEF